LPDLEGILNIKRIKNITPTQADSVREGTVSASSIMLVFIIYACKGVKVMVRAHKKLKQTKNPCPRDISYVSCCFASSNREGKTPENLSIPFRVTATIVQDSQLQVNEKTISS
jgi:hypothetical protein